MIDVDTLQYISLINKLLVTNRWCNDSFAMYRLGEEFGPAQNLHGATYTVDVEFQSTDIEDNVNWVIDIGLASDILKEVLSKYNFQNLDAIIPEENTTTEFMCRTIHGDLVSHLKSKADRCFFKGAIKVTLHESHKAWASFTDEV